MHMGIVPMSHSDLISACYKLHNLSALIYLKLVGYKGKYLAAESSPKILEIR